MHQILTRPLREPLLHFFLIAGLIYLIGARADGPTSPENDLIVIDEARVVQLSRQFNSVWQRQPDAGELDHLIAEYIREEVYYRDAL
ncbi:peptidyl-prolyl cis-trans isomerase, partial [bacterium]